MDRQATNHMALTVFVNGKAARFIVDTGASSSVMNAHEALKDGVKLTTADSPYGQYQYLKGETLQVGLIDDLRAGTMDFGRGPIALSSKANLFLMARRQRQPVDGLLGADVLLHYKTIINCRTRQLFFPIQGGRESKLATLVAGMGFVRIPLREEKGRRLTVACTFNGKAGCLLVDTGSFSTYLDAALISEMRLPTQRTSMSFSDFQGRRYEAGVLRVKDLQIGGFHLPAQNLFTLGGNFAADISREVDQRVLGVLGADLLAVQHGIIDLESMSLFLK